MQSEVLHIIQQTFIGNACCFAEREKKIVPFFFEASLLNYLFRCYLELI